jgi:hypothetical protein
VISEPAFRRAMVGLGSKKWPDGVSWRTREPVDLGDPEEPALLKRAFELAVSQGLTIEGLSYQVNLPVDLVSEIIGLTTDQRPHLQLVEEL